jgi:hypothetical protein
MQDRCMVCAKYIICSEIIWMHLMLVLGDVGHVESRFGTFGDCVSVSARYVHDLCQMYDRLRNHFGRT